MTVIPIEIPDRETARRQLKELRDHEVAVAVDHIEDPEVRAKAAEIVGADFDDRLARYRYRQSASPTSQDPPE